MSKLFDTLSLNRTTATVRCLHCDTSQTVDMAEDGPDFDCWPCHDDDCTAKLCSSCPQFKCEICELTYCEEHKADFCGLHVCRVCLTLLTDEGAEDSKHAA